MLAHQKKESAIFYLSQLPLFASLKPTVLEHFAKYADVFFADKGTVLFTPDTPHEKFYLVFSGWVKVYRETMAGDEAIIDVLNKGCTLGDIVGGGARTLSYGAEVIEAAELISLPRFILAEEVIRNGAFSLALLQHLSSERDLRDHEIEHRTVQTAPQRIGCFLLKFCLHAKDNRAVIHLPFDKTVIARRLGMQPETFSRALARLREETAIRVIGLSVEIEDIQKLVDYTCSACSSLFPCQE